MIVFPDVKINLGLSVLRRRPDGFHDLETLFIPFRGIHDTLEIIPSDTWSETSAMLFGKYSAEQTAQGITPDGKVMITLARAEGVDWDPLKDLTVKAYQLLDADFNLSSVKIYLEKTSPVGAGLGGGSADAAYALRAFSELFGLGLTDAALASYAARLGSDCAFFVYDRPMIGTGRGEILAPYDGVSVVRSREGDCIRVGENLFRIEMVIPEGIAVSTKEAYGGITPRETLQSRLAAGCSELIGTPRHPLSPVMTPTLPDLEKALALPVELWRYALVNDFEATVFAAHPKLRELKTELYGRGAVYASMSGSGSALFGLFPTG